MAQSELHVMNSFHASLETCTTCNGEGKVPALRLRLAEEVEKSMTIRSERRADALESVLRVWDYAAVWISGLLLPGAAAIVVGLLVKLALLVWSTVFFVPSDSFQEGLLGACGVIAGFAGAIIMCIWFMEAFAERAVAPWSPKASRQERKDRRDRVRALSVKAQSVHFLQGSPSNIPR